MMRLLEIPCQEKNYQGYMVFVLNLIWFATITVVVTTTYFLFPHLLVRYLELLLVTVFIGVLNHTLNNLVSPQIAAWSVSITYWLLVTVSCYTAGGIQSPHMLTQIIVVMTAGYLLGWRGGVLFAVLSVVVDLLYAYMETTGSLPIPHVHHTPMSRWIGTLIPFGTILVLQYYATAHLRTSLKAMQREIEKRNATEKEKDTILYALNERIKELRTLHLASSILHNSDASVEEQYQKIVDALPEGFQYPEITAAHISIGRASYSTKNFKASSSALKTNRKTAKGTLVSICVVYLRKKPEIDEGPFFNEERRLIESLAELIAIDLDLKESLTELHDYKFALDAAISVSISDMQGRFTFVNRNFCKLSGYTSNELLGKDHSILWSGVHSPEYFKGMAIAMQTGKTYHKDFCNKAKGGNLYWVHTCVIPFLDEHGKIYQYLSINQDITEQKEAEEKIIQSEKTLKKITRNVPANTYMFGIEESGLPQVIFMSQGTEVYFQEHDLEKEAYDSLSYSEILFEADKEKFAEEMKKAYRTQGRISFHYRIVVNNQIKWRWMQASPEKDETGKVIWYGATTDITQLVNYLISIEQIIFDISHVIRKPVATMLGVTNLIVENQLSEGELKKISHDLFKVTEEMDDFIKELNGAYNQIRETLEPIIDVSDSVNKRKDLFS